MSWFALFVAAALCYGYKNYQRIVSGKTSTNEEKRKGRYGKIKVEKTLVKVAGRRPEVIAEAALKWKKERVALDVYRRTSTSRHQEAAKVQDSSSSYFYWMCRLIDANLAEECEENQDQSQAGPLPLNISSEESPRVFLAGEAGQILNLEEFLTALDLHDYFAILHGEGYHTMNQILRATHTDLMEAGLEETPIVQIMTGVRFLYGLNHRSFMLA